jgi:hypothetical protein
MPRVGDLRTYKTSLGMGFRELGKRLNKSPQALRRLFTKDDDFEYDLKPGVMPIQPIVIGGTWTDVHSYYDAGIARQSFERKQ